jgi:signal transduction histidine kinase/CheY-like chemotaxis protein
VHYTNTASRACPIQQGDDILASPVVHDEDRAAAREAFERLLAMPGQSVTSEIRARRGEGWARVLVTAENLLDNPAVGSVLVTATDGVRRQELEMRLQQAQRLEAIGRLAGGVAHDFNNFLTTIQGLTRLCLDDALLSDDTRKDLLEVASAADRAATVTRRLLAFSRRQVMRPQQLDLNEYVRDAVKTIGRLTGEGFVVDAVAEARDAVVLVDPAQLEQIVLNLALNARDAMPLGGLLTLRTADVVVRSGDAERHPFGVPTGDYALLEMSDTGPGIPVDLRQQVFEPFFTTKSAVPGSGLGLSTVYGIVKQSGGYVWIGDADAGGARISILLPRPSAAQHAPESGAGTAAEPAGGTVLIAEDDPTVRFLARRVLAREGYTVLEAADGTRALEICASYQGRIDLLLSDVVMPGLGGSELSARCRVLRPELPVLFMSGYQEDAVLRQGVRSGAQNLLEKPFSPDELAHRVRDALARTATG